MFATDTSWKHTEAHRRLVMDSVIILKFVEMELIDAFEMHIFDNDKIEKQAVAHYR